MVRLFEDLRKMNDDLRHSWYFRCWIVVWIVLAVISLVAFIEFAARSGEASKEKNWQLYVDTPTELEFPQFHVNPVDVGITLMSGVCSQEGKSIKQIGCSSGQPSTACMAFQTTGVVAYASSKDFNQGLISCNFTTTAYANTTNFMLVWDVDGPSINQYHGQYFGPRATPGALVNLVPVTIEPYGSAAYFVWRPQIEYLTNAPSTNFYSLNIRIDRFYVEHYQEKDLYSGWQAMGDFGGFVFWCVILHIITMALFGLAFQNNSTFLGTVHSGSTEERGQLL